MSTKIKSKKENGSAQVKRQARKKQYNGKRKKEQFKDDKSSTAYRRTSIYDSKKPPVYVSQVPTQQAVYQSQVRVSPDWNEQVTQEMQAALTSYFLSRNIASGEDAASKMAVFYDGMLTQFQGLVSEASSAEVRLSTRLSIINDLIAAFRQKDVTKHKMYKVSYGWSDVKLPTVGTYNTGWNNWQFTIPDTDNNQYDTPATVYIPTPSSAAYSDYLAQIKAITGAKAKMLTAVDSSTKSVLDKDVSAFAKVYSYLGLNPSSSGGFYNDVENEVEITAPVLSHNVVYPLTKQDDRVPTKLTTNEGGPGVNLAPLLPLYDSWFNKVPINFKFCDFFELVNTLIYWYIGLVQLDMKDTDQPFAYYTLPFTFQDFTIMIRNSLMSTFRDQWIGQFLGPLAYESNSTNFLPFQILGNCTGNDTFNRVLVPPIIAENLSMLQSIKWIDPDRKSKLNTTLYVPVWGFYDDIQPDWVFPDALTPVNVFQTLSQSKINLVDCSISGKTYVNTSGSYYAYVQEVWNTKISGFKTQTNVCDLANLSPPSHPLLLSSTRVYGYVKQQQQEAIKSGAMKRLPFPALSPISNLNTMVKFKMEKQSSQKDVVAKKVPTLPQPTSVQYITEDDRYSAIPVLKEYNELINYLIIPSVRLDPQSANDVLNKTMYQTITGEGLSQIQNTNSNAPAYLNRQLDMANLGIEGKGKIYSSAVSIVLNKLASEGNGGMLASILGGIGKMIVPSASGAIDAIASAVPF